MGTNFTAIIDHDLSPWEVVTLPDRFNDTRLGIHHAMARYRAALGEPSLVAAGAWEPEYYEATSGISPAACWAEDRGYELRYASDWSLAVCRRACAFGGRLRWQTFLTVAAVHEATRELCRVMARALGSPRVLYLPDSAFPASVALDRLFTSPARVADLVAWLDEHGVERGALRACADDPANPDHLGERYYTHSSAARYYLDDLAHAILPVWNEEN